jgi:KipI family sensor histidine kinase inhibitor
MTTAPAFSPSISLLGEAAACLQLPPPIPGAAQARLVAMGERLRRSGRFSDVVPGWGNLTVVFDPLALNGDTVLAELAAAWAKAPAQPSAARERVLKVRYGGAHGPDLPALAAHAGLSEAEVVALHAGAAYRVAFVGFQPGFAYLSGLPAALHMPRRAEPRTRVPPGSVAIGGAQTGVYPAASPGGWQLIGQTDQRLFDPVADEPSWLQPGDVVRFEVAGV